MLQETGDRTNFQGRYILRHPWTGKTACDAGQKYRDALPARFRQEAANLANLTGWQPAAIEARMEATGQSLTQRGEVRPSAALTRCNHAARRSPAPGSRHHDRVNRRDAR